MATDGWNYRKAYFQDFDGRYYSVTISVAKGANGNMVYNIGNMKEEASPKVKGSSAGNGNGPRGSLLLTPVYAAMGRKVKKNFLLLRMCRNLTPRRTRRSFRSRSCHRLKRTLEAAAFPSRSSPELH